MDDKYIFKQAIMHIFGNFILEDVMVSIFKFLQKKMPVDLMYLQFYEKVSNSLRIISMAKKNKAMKVDLVTPLSAKGLQTLKDLVREYYQQKKSNYTFLFKDNPKSHQTTREVLELHKIEATSLMVMPLMVGDEFLGGGSLVLITEGARKFTQKHADLVSLLKDPFSISMANALKHQELKKLKDMLADDNRYLQGELRRILGDEIVGANFGLKDTMHKVQQVARLDSPVLLLGETGVGKDVIANAIHYSSNRKDGPFISVNCGAIPESLIDSELFGHEKGAFTGALSQKRGRFERANQGTIFLDEIGELPPEAQVRLLKVLQDKEIERVGGTETIHLDIRIIAATNRNLEEMITARQFREDLWFRLNVFPIVIPPLRDRRSDIPDLLQHFINHKVKEMKLHEIPRISPGATDLLMHYDWPGNVRELENVVERSMILNPSGPLSFEHLNLGSQTGFSENQGRMDDELTLDELTSKYIQKALSKANGKIHGKGGAADLLGINPNTLRNRMNKLGIEYRKSKNV